MLESGLSGSVRGVPSNGHPYRDPGSECDFAGEGSYRRKADHSGWCTVGKQSRPPSVFMTVFVRCRAEASIAALSKNRRPDQPIDSDRYWRRQY